MAHAPDEAGQTVERRRPVLVFGVLALALSAIVAAAIVELAIVSLLHAPALVARAPRPIASVAQQIYRHFNRSLIQFDPSCAQYDPEVTYTLKPGACTFANIEFSTSVHVNHAGLRDSETALASPDVIVLGDSHAMGWGVEDDQTLTRVLARQTGLKVLNAAISSYGTVREMRMLDRLDTSALKVLVVQYTDNDLVENLSFVRHGGQLQIMSEAKYQGIVDYYRSQRRYYPGKYVYRVLMKVLRLEQPEPDQEALEPVTSTEEASLFLNALAGAGRTPLDGVQVIVFEINEQIDPPRPFIAALDEVRRRDTNPAFVRQLIPVDVSRRLTRSNFYALDDHMRASGHEAVGKALAQVIRLAVAR